MPFDPTPYPNLIELLHRVAHKAPGGRKFAEIAELMGKEYSTLSSELNPGVETHKFGAADLLLLMELTGSDAPVHFLAAKRGGMFVKLPSANPDNPVDLAGIKVVKEFGELMAAYGGALEDGTIDRQDRRDIQKEGYEALTAIMALLKQVEEMETD